MRPQGCQTVNGDTVFNLKSLPTSHQDLPGCPQNARMLCMVAAVCAPPWRVRTWVDPSQSESGSVYEHDDQANRKYQ